MWLAQEKISVQHRVPNECISILQDYKVRNFKSRTIFAHTIKWMSLVFSEIGALCLTHFTVQGLVLS